MRWQHNRQRLMRQAPEMGIALLNVDLTALSLIYHNGFWELADRPSGQPSSLTPAHQVVAERSLLIDSNARALVIWGLGLGYWYLHLKPWLGQDRTRQLIFCESEVMITAAFLHMPWADELLSDPQVHVRAHFSGMRERSALREIAWLCMLLPLQFLQSETLDLAGHYALHRVKAAEQMVRGAQGQFDQIAAELLQFSEPFYINFYTNFLRRSHTVNARFLKGAFADLTALICGAGPSLKGQVADLKKAAKGVLLIGGGSGVNFLTAQGLSPHLGLAIDPNPLQEQRLRAHTGFSLPYLFRRRLFAAGLDAICGPRILVEGGAGYPLIDWLDSREWGDCDQVDTIDEGHNVMHFAIDTARFMGIGDQFLCGMDLAYGTSGGYAPGVLKGHVSASIASEKLCCADPLIFHPSDLGQNVKTHWKWVEEARWIGEYGARSPNVKLSNATRGGLGISGVKRVKLAALFTSAHPQRDLTNRVWLEMQRARAFEEKQKVDSEQLLEPIWQSLFRIKALCQQMEKIVSEDEMIEMVKSGRADLIFAKLEGELAYLMLLKFADQMHQVIVKRSLRPLAKTDVAEEAMEDWPINLRAVAMWRRIHFLSKGCALHQLWWDRAQKIVKRARSAKLNKTGAQLPNLSDLSDQLLEKSSIQGGQMKIEKLRQRLASFGKRSKMGDELMILEPSLGIDIRVAASNHLITSNERSSKNLLKERTGDAQDRSNRLHSRKNALGEIEELWQQLGQKREGQSFLLYPGGSIKGEAFYKEHQLHGPARFFLPNGQLTSELFFAHGERQGYQRQFYADGTLHSCGGYRDDERLGLHWSFHPDGTLKSKIGYSADQIDGSVQIFHADGSPSRRARFVKGAREGWDRQWSQEGRRAFEARYTKGKPMGQARRWHANGQLAERLIHLEPGGRVETVQFSDQGRKICQGKYLDATHYILKLWNERGELINEERLIWRNGSLGPK